MYNLRGLEKKNEQYYVNRHSLGKDKKIKKYNNNNNITHIVCVPS